MHIKHNVKMQKTLSLKFCFGSAYFIETEKLFAESAYFIETEKLFAESTINKGKN